MMAPGRSRGQVQVRPPPPGPGLELSGACRTGKLESLACGPGPGTRVTDHGITMIIIHSH
jgi:hypothetical protein